MDDSLSRADLGHWAQAITDSGSWSTAKAANPPAPRKRVSHRTRLLRRLRTRQATVAIIGLGYVGLPLLLRFAEAGYDVIGLDVDEHKLQCLREGRSYLGHLADVSALQRKARSFTATTETAELARADAIIICVPTPLGRHREPDLSFVTRSLDAIAPHLRPGQVVSLESTTYPGTTEEEVVPRIRTRGLQPGRDVFVLFSPEREDPGNPRFHTANIPKVCGGLTPDCLRVGLALYGHAVERVVPVSSTRAAELTKLLENIHRAVNIGLVNEMKMIADRMGIDIHEVIRAASSKPFGFQPYQPGPGLGGHCIPIDPFYLTWKARAHGVHTRFIELAGEINSAMPQWVLGKCRDALNVRGMPLKGTRILLLGLAYKRNIGDTRESPAIELMHRLEAEGARVDYADPHVPSFVAEASHGHPPAGAGATAAADPPAGLRHSASLDAQALAAYDMVVITTDHEGVDYERVRRHARLIVDTRGVFRQREAHIVPA
jgi:UDP-N-acetyl-D-glucosamine dehydrogenase